MISHVLSTVGNMFKSSAASTKSNIPSATAAKSSLPNDKTSPVTQSAVPGVGTYQQQTARSATARSATPDPNAPSNGAATKPPVPPTATPADAKSGTTPTAAGGPPAVAAGQKDLAAAKDRSTEIQAASKDDRKTRLAQEQTKLDSLNRREQQASDDIDKYTSRLADPNLSSAEKAKLNAKLKTAEREKAELTPQAAAAKETVGAWNTQVLADRSMYRKAIDKVGGGGNALNMGFMGLTMAPLAVPMVSGMFAGKGATDPASAAAGEPLPNNGQPLDPSGRPIGAPAGGAASAPSYSGTVSTGLPAGVPPFNPYSGAPTVPPQQTLRG